MRADDWLQAWTGGRRAVHIGDVADFNARFLAQSPGAREQGHHYSCLAAFYSPHPAALLLPHQVEEGWIRWLERELAWDPVELHSGLAVDRGMAEALAARPALRQRIEGLGLPVHRWGRPDLPTVRRYEAKSASSALFGRVAADHPGITVPRQEPADSPRRLARLLTRRAGRGETTVLKADHGVGGFGTALVTPEDVHRAGGGRELLRRLARDGVLPEGGGLRVEEYVESCGGRLRDLTFDAVIGADGGVHPVGVGVMRVVGTGYRGATVGPGTVPAPLADTAVRFGLAVGEVLAAEGHRGWYDIDFVTHRTGRLAPTETNLRLTGPAVAFMLRARLDAVRGPGHHVRTLDRLPLGARLPQSALLAHLESLAARCRPFGATLLPTIPTASFDPHPSVGVALAATSPDALEAAEAVVRHANAALGEPFGALPAGS
ncbi:hypothetical protein [Kitasatospora camelliae]|uniref:ATP-grasp domain-containing protein n=1 Tax=Kitasatospora camelliae TaxID=3156397 RepID=A0AAU8JRC6_9ACTN